MKKKTVKMAIQGSAMKRKQEENERAKQSALSASTKAQVHFRNYKMRVKPRRKDTPSLRALSYLPKV